MLSLSSSYSPIHSVQTRSAKNTATRAPTYSFTQRTTAVSYPWPPTVTGIERIVLSAQGDLQRVLSAYFARPISIAVVYANTYWQRSPNAKPEPLNQFNQKTVASASPETPIIQTRQVHLQCSGKTVCTATSTVRITCPRIAHLFLVDKYAIGQMFRQLEKLPVFELLSVGLGPCGQESGANVGQNWSESCTTSPSLFSECTTLRRRYKLAMPNFECDIVEVFPDRRMFVHGEAWLDGRAITDNDVIEPRHSASKELRMEVISAVPWFANMGNKGLMLGLGFVFILAYELTLSVLGGRDAC